MDYDGIGRHQTFAWLAWAGWLGEDEFKTRLAFDEKAVGTATGTGEAWKEPRECSWGEAVEAWLARSLRSFKGFV